MDETFNSLKDKTEVRFPDKYYVIRKSVGTLKVTLQKSDRSPRTPSLFGMHSYLPHSEQSPWVSDKLPISHASGVTYLRVRRRRKAHISCFEYYDAERTRSPKISKAHVRIHLRSYQTMNSWIFWCSTCGSARWYALSGGRVDLISREIKNDRDSREIERARDRNKFPIPTCWCVYCT